MIIKTSFVPASGVEGMPKLNPSLVGMMMDILVVNNYITSKQMLSDINSKIDIREMYSSSQIDWLARLKPSFRKNRIHEETIHKYWKSKVTVHLDHTTGITEFQVVAFTPKDAKKIADEILVLSEQLVNRLSERAKKNTLEFAKAEVEEYRAKAIETLSLMAAFQERVQQVDPEAFAVARSKIEAALEGELTGLETQLDLMRKSLSEDAPGIALGKERTAVLAAKLAKERAKSTMSQGGESAAQILSGFAKVKLETEFAAKAYLSSLKSLEFARMEAQKQTIFLETFDEPRVPDSSEYPRRLTNTFVVFVSSLLIWAVGGLMIAAAREHI